MYASMAFFSAGACALPMVLGFLTDEVSHNITPHYNHLYVTPCRYSLPSPFISCQPYPVLPCSVLSWTFISLPTWSVYYCHPFSDQFNSTLFSPRLLITRYSHFSSSSKPYAQLKLSFKCFQSNSCLSMIGELR